MASILELRRGDWIAVLYRSYIDDSKDQKQEEIVTAGAVVAAHGDWSAIRNQWKARLRRDGLKYFRSTDYYSLRGEFDRFRDPKKYPKPEGSETAKKLRDDLEKILNNAPVIGIGVAIPVKLYREFRETIPGAAEKFGSDIFYSALQTLMIECGWTVRDHMPLDKKNRPNRLSFIYDKDERAAFYGAIFDDFQKRNPVVGEMLDGLVPLDDKLHPPLQAADMMASLTKELMLPWLPEVTTRHLRLADLHKEPPRLKNTAYRIVYWDWEWMEVLLAGQNFGKDYASLVNRVRETS
jgi:hypothetical protein